MYRRAAVLLVPVTLAAIAYHAPVRAPVRDPEPILAPADTSFARLIDRLSEPGGFFDSDNLISNEASYLHVMGVLRRRGVQGGAYVGVGPDQSFSYIAEIRPEIAFIIDIRRDNLLHHLLFKALFANARNRTEYLALLFAREPPADIERWTGRELDDVVTWIDRQSPDEEQFATTADRIRRTVESFGIPLDSTDYATIRRFHRAFFAAGLGLRFTSRGRSTRSYYPTYRDLLLETDLEGTRANYLADEERFRVVKDLEARDRIIPVVGNLAGDHALAAIGDEVRRRGLVVSALYTSNVEYYLMLDRIFEHFAATVAESLPYDDTSVLIRSYFGRGWPHPQNLRGYYATQLAEPLSSFVEEQRAGGYTSYAELVSRNVLENR